MLESVEGGENVGRYTFIGIRPYRKMVSRGEAIEITEKRKNAPDRRRHFRALETGT